MDQKLGLLIEGYQESRSYEWWSSPCGRTFAKPSGLLRKFGLSEDFTETAIYPGGPQLVRVFSWCDISSMTPLVEDWAPA
ncbi:hypothetical protein R1flu_001081 [Riccia fluitans]|uniref:Uncharacterized protein n=1 Tax=Riccia fluitans TaxID=41844 RepID=A0ABD1Y295_9MARC